MTLSRVIIEGCFMLTARDEASYELCVERWVMLASGEHLIGGQRLART